jgi:acetyltransferase-like isoleucine patch superfamily enzyme
MSVLKSIIGRIFNFIRFRRNHVGYFRSLGVQIGEGMVFYGPKQSMFSTEPYLVKIGRDCHITPDVEFVPHDRSALLFRKEVPTLDLLAPIVIGDRVFIGTRSTILLGVTVGNDCIIAAGSLVNRDVPSGTIVGGVPAKQIGTVESFRERAIARSTRTKGMADRKKRDMLLALYKDRLGL